MKTFAITITFAVLALCSCGSRQDNRVYICTGQYSKAYHKTGDCFGLNRCSGDIEKVTEKEAKDMERHKCTYCY